MTSSAGATQPVEDGTFADLDLSPGLLAALAALGYE